MLEARVAQITAVQGGVVARRQLLALGFSPGGIAWRVRTHRLFAVAHGVYALSPYVDAWGARFAAVLSTGGDPLVTGRAISDGQHDATASIGRDRPRVVVVSHWSALHVHGVTEAPPPIVHVTAEGTGSRPRRGVRVHRARTLAAGDLDVVRNLPVTALPRTILDCALGASTAQVRRLIREAEYRELLDFGAIGDVLRRHPFHPASPTLRRADPSTAESRRGQTPIEDRMAALLARLPIDAPQAQLPVAGRSGRTYRADFAWTDHRLIVETDGRASHDRSTSFQSDRDRDADLAAAGWLTLRFTSLQLDDAARVAETLLATIRTRPRAAPRR